MLDFFVELVTIAFFLVQIPYGAAKLHTTASPNTMNSARLFTNRRQFKGPRSIIIATNEKSLRSTRAASFNNIRTNNYYQRHILNAASFVQRNEYSQCSNEPLLSRTIHKTAFVSVDGRQRGKIPLVNKPSLASSLQRLEISPPQPRGYGTSIGIDDLNESQREATLRPRYSITRVVAGPGAGKTKVLTCRIAHLLLSSEEDSRSIHDGNNRNEGILAVTFTKKAASEMERRLKDLLISSFQATNSESNSILTAIDGDMCEGDLVHVGNADPYDEGGNSIDATNEMIRRATVGTFHSVCAKILRKFGKELGDLPTVRDSVGAHTVSDPAQTANTAILTLDGSFNILDQSDQLRLLKDVLKEHHIELKGATTAALGGRNNAADIRPITVLNALSVLNTEVAMARSIQTGSDLSDSENKMGKKVRQIATQIRSSFQKAKFSQNSVDFDDLMLLTRELLLRNPEVREILHRRWRHVLVDEFQDTSQIQLDLVRLLTTNSLFIVGDGDQSIYSWRGASPESMSDFEEAFHDRKHGWDGLLEHEIDLTKYLENICRHHAMLSDENRQRSLLKVKTVYLMENYRSTTNIVKAAQRVITASGKSGCSSSDEKTTRSSQDEIRQDMKPMRGTGPSPRVLACKDGKAEANFVVNTVNSMVNSGELTPSSTVAFIYRTNAQSRLLEEACVEQNLRYVVRGSTGTFYKRAEVQDCMCFLKIMYNSRDRSAWARAVRTPSRGIGETSLDEFFRYCDSVTDKFMETPETEISPPTPMDIMLSLAPSGNCKPEDIGMYLPPRNIMSTRSINRFIPFAKSLKSLMEKAAVLSVPELLSTIIDDLDLKSHFDTISKSRDEFEDRLSNVMELIRASDRYSNDGPCIKIFDDEAMSTPLGNFLDDVALIADIDVDESDANDGGRVVANLMTIHASKGMEFDAVFLVGNEEGTFPTQKAIGEGENSIELSEERRLCYVAMTRAKTHLIMTWRREVSYFTGAGLRTKEADRSRFLDILVSKQEGKPKREVVHNRSITSLNSPSQRAAMSNSRPTQNNSFRKGDFHNESKTSTNAKSPLQRNSFYQKSSDQLDSDRKRSFHNESAMGNAANLIKRDKKSWDSWTPSHQKKSLREVPTIRQIRSPSVGPEGTQDMVSSQCIKRHKRNDDVAQRPPRPSPISQRRTHSFEQPIPSIRRNEISTRGNRNNSFKSDPPPETDSTLFFPVGSIVKHRVHGHGIVQHPPPGDVNFVENMLVRVRFENDVVTYDLPMDGLTHTYDSF